MHGCNKIRGAGDKGRLMSANKSITSHGRYISRTRRKSEQIPIIIIRHMGGDETSAAFFRFDNYDGIGKAGDYTVTLHKKRCERLRTGREFSEQTAMLQRSDRFGTMLVRIDTIEAVSRDNNWIAALWAAISMP